MCLIIMAWDTHPRYKLIFAGNRDEYHARPSAGAHWWDGGQTVLGGRDLEAGGTWLAVSRAGRFAVVTNFREREAKVAARPASRGALVSDFVQNGEPPGDFLTRLAATRDQYAGYNLIFGDSESLLYYSNRGNGGAPLSAGIHGVSNHQLDTPWPKLERVRGRMSAILGQSDPDPRQLFEMMEDRRPASDSELPDAGAGEPLERLLSAPFVVSGEYGTRSTTVIRVTRAGVVTFVEKQFAASGDAMGLSRFKFNLEPSAASS